ncbi:UNKNOWN [Stylonychia lemnae]|uniref:Uncharacterized protein n=1 Tax=Stylonychia lemnae TaxID=5949 RepID=A0A077ZUB2_STYLE|nr:UNKNOWN [Stylonychia lemnae]|eukprot:CDW73159.1 UNKNOWN [Stylonychia lemnae]
MKDSLTGWRNESIVDSVLSGGQEIIKGQLHISELQNYGNIPLRFNNESQLSQITEIHQQSGLIVKKDLKLLDQNEMDQIEMLNRALAQEDLENQIQKNTDAANQIKQYSRNKQEKTYKQNKKRQEFETPNKLNISLDPEIDAETQQQLKMTSKKNSTKELLVYLENRQLYNQQRIALKNQQRFFNRNSIDKQSMSRFSDENGQSNQQTEDDSNQIQLMLPKPKLINFESVYMHALEGTPFHEGRTTPVTQIKKQQRVTVQDLMLMKDAFIPSKMKQSLSHQKLNDSLQMRNALAKQQQLNQITAEHILLERSLKKQINRFSSKQEISPVRDQKQIMLERNQMIDTMSGTPNLKSLKHYKQIFSPEKRKIFALKNQIISQEMLIETPINEQQGYRQKNVINKISHIRDDSQDDLNR